MSITNGAETLRTAYTYLGDREGPPNRSGAAVIDKCQSLYGLTGTPWCSSFLGYVIAESDASPAYKAAAKAIMSPSTQVTADRARAKGWLTVRGDNTASPGDLFVIPGRHIGMFWAARSGGTFTTIEGNHQDSVASVLRSWRDGWQRISLPDVGTAPASAAVDGYGFDDMRVKLYGGWPTPEARDQQLARYAAAYPDQWTQAVRVQAESPYAFRAGPVGTYDSWQYGPWMGTSGKVTRDEQQQKWQAANKGATARPWRRKYGGS